MITEDKLRRAMDRVMDGASPDTLIMAPWLFIALHRVTMRKRQFRRWRGKFRAGLL